MRAANILLVGLSLALASVSTALAASDNRDLSSQEMLTSIGTATVRGKVSVTGTRQKTKALPVFKSRAFCGATVPNETLLISAEGGLQNTVVLLHPLDRKPLAPQTKALILDNKRCAFVPHVQAAPVGSELLLKNSDPILHTVHARLGKETLFNVGLPKWRQVSKRLDRTGVIRIDCDVLHTWMSAVIIVTDTPYYTISDERGAFALGGLPVGSYDMEIWHEKLGTLRQRILMDKAAASEFDIIYSLEPSR